MGKIYISTCAYNAEKTLRRCVDSVLKQTYNDFIFYLCDNASTDRTGEIIEQYASQDSRIVPSHNNINHEWSDNLEYALLPHKISDDDYFCLLDADDELYLTFFDEMLEFLQNNNLDLAACGSDFIDANSGAVMGVRNIGKELILKNENDFSNYFIDYHQFMRTGWAKLYTGKIARQRYVYSDYPPGFPKAYGGDTYIVFHCLRSANRVGIYPRTLHKYYLSNKSRSYQFNLERISCDCILFDDAIDFLRTKCGYISEINKDFLIIVYMNAITDTIRTLIDSKLERKEKLDNLLKIFEADPTKLLISSEDLGMHLRQGTDVQQQRRVFFSSVSDWLRSLEEVSDEQVEAYCETGQLLSAVAESSESWLFFAKVRVSFLIEQGRTDEAELCLIELESLLPGDGDLISLRERFF